MTNNGPTNGDGVLDFSHLIHGLRGAMTPLSLGHRSYDQHSQYSTFALLCIVIVFVVVGVSRDFECLSTL